MNYYVSTPTGSRCLALCREHGYREFACPVRTHAGRLGRRSVRVSLEHFALDNGAWLFHTTGGEPSWAPFVDALVSIGPRADFVVAPDIVAGGLASLRLTETWLPWVLMHSQLALVPVQDGMEPDDVAPLLLRYRAGIFVGGSFAWKWTTVSTWARFARERGIYIHVGRVNSEKRSRLCADLGIDSCDGSTVAKWSKTAGRMADSVNPNRQAQRHLL